MAAGSSPQSYSPNASAFSTGSPAPAPKRVGTHNGSFHCDEALACFMIRLTRKFADAEIVRTRDPQLLDTLDAVLDVGGVYDPTRDRYDHHQKGFNEIFGHGFNTKLSSAGLIYKHYGTEIIAKELQLDEGHPDVHRVYPAVYKSFVEAIDAIDNGINQYDTEQPPKYVNNRGLSSRVGRLNLDWMEPDQSAEKENESFQRAMMLAGGEFLESVRFHAKSWLPARPIVMECLAARRDIDPSGGIMVLNRFCPNEDLRIPIRIGDRVTSDVVVRVRTDEGRDDWFYCHSKILTDKSKYFAERLSNDWPTCQILDSRNCVDVYCSELEFNFHVNTLRLLYVTELDTWHGVRNTLGILQVADRLGCHQMARACVDYLEAVPWDETEEEEILRTIPCLGVPYEQILARLHPVDPAAIVSLFISAIHFATSTQPAVLHELKHSAQEQLEYLLTEDDDSPLLTVSDELIRSEVSKCVSDLLGRFDAVLESLLSGPLDKKFESDDMQVVQSLLSDLSWVCQILTKMEMMKDLVHHWVESSAHIVNAVEHLASSVSMLVAKLKVVEVAFKVLEAIGYGHVILPTCKRLHMVNVWLPFVQKTGPSLEPADLDNEIASAVKVDSEMWQSLESAFISIMLTLPSRDLADILAAWLMSEHVRYPDLTEAFEVWCYRSKIAKRRFALSHATQKFAK